MLHAHKDLFNFLYESYPDKNFFDIIMILKDKNLNFENLSSSKDNLLQRKDTDNSKKSDDLVSTQAISFQDRQSSVESKNNGEQNLNLSAPFINNKNESLIKGDTRNTDINNSNKNNNIYKTSELINKLLPFNDKVDLSKQVTQNNIKTCQDNGSKSTVDIGNQDLSSSVQTLILNDNNPFQRIRFSDLNVEMLNNLSDHDMLNNLNNAVSHFQSFNQLNMLLNPLNLLTNPYNILNPQTLMLNNSINQMHHYNALSANYLSNIYRNNCLNLMYNVNSNL